MSYSPKNIRGGIENLKERHKIIERMTKDLETDAVELLKSAYKDHHRKQIKEFLEKIS